MEKYFVAAKAGLSSALERRFDFFVGIFSTVFPIIIQSFLWLAIYNGSQKSLYGYTFPQMMLYVVMAGTVSLFVNTGIENVFNADIHSGALGIYLCKPINYILFRVFHTFGSRLPAIVTTAVYTSAVLVIIRLMFGVKIGIVTILLFIISLLLGMALNFCIFFLVSLSGLWLTEVGSFFATISVVIMVISGGVFPVSVMGNTFVMVTRYLPFMYTTFFPVSVITGALSINKIMINCAIQIFWILLLITLAKFIWQRGIRKYVSVGG